MSLWTDIRDFGERVVTLGAYNPEASREADRAVAAQMAAYKQQTALTQQQLNNTRNQEIAEKRQVEQKQIRALRGTYRPAGTGLLGVGAQPNQDMSSNLGG